MIKTAMIFAAGEGKRMLPLTLHTPKPLLKVAGKPLIFWHLERLAAQGIQQVVINVSYLGEQIMNAVQDGSAWGLKVIYSIEETPLETGGGLLKALPLLGETPFLLVNGDVWCGELPEFPPLVNGEDALIFMQLVNNPSHNPDGDFCFANDSGQLTNKCSEAITSKTVTNKTTASKTFAGISRIHPKMLDDKWLTAAYGQTFKAGDAFILSPLLRLMIDKQRAKAAVFKGTWVDVGTPQRLADLNASLL